MELKIGDSVIIKRDTEVPDVYFDISGWQGRVSEISEKYEDNRIALIKVDWDSITLKQIPDKYIQECEEEGYGWDSMYLYVSDVVITKERDKHQDVREIVEQVGKKHYWSHLGKTGQRIAKILNGINPANELKSYSIWEEYLNKNLKFPFKVVVTHSENNWLVQENEQINIHSLSIVDDTYGIIAKGKISKKTVEFPLGYLKVINDTGENFELIGDYYEWYANK